MAADIVLDWITAVLQGQGIGEAPGDRFLADGRVRVDAVAAERPKPPIRVGQSGWNPVPGRESGRRWAARQNLLGIGKAQ